MQQLGPISPVPHTQDLQEMVASTFYHLEPLTDVERRHIKEALQGFLEWQDGPDSLIRVSVCLDITAFGGGHFRREDTSGVVQESSEVTRRVPQMSQDASHHR